MAVPLRPRDDQSSSPDLSSLLRWLDHHGGGVDLELACAEHPAPDRRSFPRARHDVVRLPCCVADLPEHCLIEMLGYGAARVRLRLDGCATPNRARARFHPLIALLDVLGHAGNVQLIEEPPTGRRRGVLQATRMPVGRRQVLMLPGSRSTELPAPFLSHHERLVGALRRLVPSPPATLVATKNGAADLLGPGVLLRAPDCTACGICVHTCPEDALSLSPATGDEDVLGLTTPIALAQTPSRCDGCGVDPLCVQACPVRTLEVVAPRPWSSLWRDRAEEIVQVPTVRCARCRAQFRAEPGEPSDHGNEPSDHGNETDAGAGEEVLCPACRQRRANPFGMALPPEALERLDPEVLRALGYQPATAPIPAALDLAEPV